MQGRGNPGEHFGQFYCFERPWREQQRVLITLSKSDTDTIMSDVENIHHTVDREISSEGSGENGMQGRKSIAWHWEIGFTNELIKHKSQTQRGSVNYHS